MLRDLKVKNSAEHHQKIRGLSCQIPFNDLQIYDNGEVTNCCYTWMPKVIGNVTENSLLTLIQSSRQLELQKSVTDGSFKFCDCKTCPSLATYINSGEASYPLTTQRIENHSRVLKIYLNYDKSCNLRCPSCRNDFIFYSEKEVPEKLTKIHQSVMKSVDELLAAGYHLDLNITGSGDPFASPLYSHLLATVQEHPHLSLSLQTNGVLMNDTRWTPKLQNLLTFLNVSVDASTEETYNRVRPGGRFQALRKNVQNFDNKVNQGHFPKLSGWQMNFIVQKDNFLEIPEFLEWALAHQSVGIIWFNLIADWGHLTKSQFSDRAVWMEGHPDHEKFQNVLKCDLLKHPKVNLGNMAHFI